MPVFISHISDDTELAAGIEKRLKELNIETSVEVLDLMPLEERIVNKILERLNSCTHLLSIVSTQMVGVWWLPFEIGVAAQADKRIAIYSIASIELFQYLKMWPVLTKLGHLDFFTNRYLSDRLILEKGYNLYEAKITLIQKAPDFHQLLKFDLGQG